MRSVEVADRKRRSNRCVVAGVSLIAVALILSARHVTHPMVTTVGAVVGFALLSYGVHVGWLVFYDREPDGPPS